MSTTYTTDEMRTNDISSQIRRRIIDTCLLMESDLSFPYTVAALAEYADFSPFHFQRVFRLVVGETVIAHLRRLRLARAAYVLKNSDCAITSVALDSGFETHTGFTHAFTRTYGMSPAEFRSQNMRQPFIRLPNQNLLNVDTDAIAACPLSVQIERTPIRRIALMRYTGPTRSMGKIWLDMIPWCRKHGMVDDDSLFFGLHHDDWDESDQEDTSQYRYDAAVAVNSGFEAEDGVSTTFIPGGETAVVHFHGTLKDLERTWRIFAYQWLPVSGYQPRLNYFYDIYPASLMLSNHLSQIVATLVGLQVTLCIPVARVPMAIGDPIR